MASVEVTAEKVIVHVEGADQFWALKSQVELPLAHVVGAEIDPATAEEWNQWYLGLRIPGTHVPGVIAAGTFYHHGELVFWDIHHPEKAITLRLAHEKYGRLVIEVDDPAATVTMIQQALGNRSAS